MWVLDDSTGQLRDKQEDQGVDLSGGAVAGGGSPVNTGVSSANSIPTQPAASSDPAPTSSGNFTNINKYLAMNQPQSEALGQRVAGGIQSQTDAAGNALTTGENAFNQQVQAAAPGLSSDDIKKISQNGYVDFANDPNNVQKFQATAAGQYSGPNAFSDVSNYQDLMDQVGKASQAAEQVKTTGGREGLIKDVYSRPERATTGMLGLDEALVHGTPDAMNSVNAASDNAAKLNDRIKDIEDSAGKAVAAQQANVQNSQKEIQNDFLGTNGAYTNLVNGITGETTAAQTAAQKAADEAKQWTNLDWLRSNGIFSNAVKAPWAQSSTLPSISDSALQQLGVTRDQFNDLINKQAQVESHQDWFTNPMTPTNPKYVAGQTPSPVLSSFGDYENFGSPVGITASNVASPQEYAELSALGKLLPNSVDQTMLTTPDQAGKYNPDITDFKYNDLINYLNNQNNYIQDYPNRSELSRG